MRHRRCNRLAKRLSPGSVRRPHRGAYRPVRRANRLVLVKSATPLALASAANVLQRPGSCDGYCARCGHPPPTVESAPPGARRAMAQFCGSMSALVTPFEEGGVDDAQL